MAELTQANMATPTGGDNDLPGAGLKDNPLFRQLAVMVGIAASVALGVAVVLWSQTPNFSPLYGNLGQKDAAEVVAVLEQSGVEFRIDESTGMVLVPSGKVQELRMQLASQGLPNTSGTGMEILDKDTGFGTSRMVEQARYHHALEGELARTIGTLASVEAARVHLALPKQSVFVRQRKQPSASVVLKLFNGRKLEQSQVDAIVHLVAASIPELEASRVTVVDQKGRLLSEQQSDRGMKLSASQFDYTQKIEANYRKRIEDLLAPILGADSVKATVTADIDFTVTEQTQERYNPDQPALRSEQVNEQASRTGSEGGVPGALSNQPPAAGAAPQQTAGSDTTTDNTTPLNSSRQATRNYELDRVVSHTRLSPNSIRRLSVAVVVDDVVEAGPEGKPVRRERTPEEVERISALVREAVGFDARRGDTVKVINSTFQAPEPIAALPEQPLWEQAWVWDVAKQAGGALVVLLLIFGVLRPTLKRLTATPVAEMPGELAVAGAAAGGGEASPAALPDAGAEAAPASRKALGADGKPIALTGPAAYENVMEAARKLVDNDPKRVAQLVKTWIAEDAS
jgi:flagellar M-ring protein FliF